MRIDDRSNPAMRGSLDDRHRHPSAARAVRRSARTGTTARSTAARRGRRRPGLAGQPVPLRRRPTPAASTPPTRRGSTPRATWGTPGRGRRERLAGCRSWRWARRQQSDHTILYAATSGGTSGATTSAAARSPRTARALTSTTVDAGIYRYVLVPAPTLTLKLSGLKGGALRLGRSLSVSGRVTPARFGHSKVKLTVQRKRGTKWVTVKTVTRASSSLGAYSWKYKPGKPRQLPSSGERSPDDQDGRRDDEVACVQGEVASRRRGRQGGRVRSDSSASAHPDRPVRASTTFPVHRRR